MRLLHRNGHGELCLTEDISSSLVPRYAILSHTWDDGHEVTFQDMQNNTGKDKKGWNKLAFCEKMSREAKIDYFWIDTCCIDKSSSAELQEAIASMFRWYSEAKICLVYLSDVDFFQDWRSAFMKSKWFTRGWTLQELLAPENVEFYSKQGKFLGNKRILEDMVHERTNIDRDALRGKHLSRFSKASRFSWASGRDTKRAEDAAYSLCGIFDVSLPIIYGEGRGKAFRRLHEEIAKDEERHLQDMAAKHMSESQDDDETNRKREEDRRRAEEQEKLIRRREILVKSLLFAEMHSRHASIREPHAKTCRWILRQREYRDWVDAEKLSDHNGFLWIKGKPGAGKSTLMKYVFGQAHDSIARCRAISYFFNARGTWLEKSTFGTYQSILSQLIQQSPGLEKIFDSESSALVDQEAWTLARPWNTGTLRHFLAKAVGELTGSHVLCFIDALDECEETQIRDMVSSLEILGALAVSKGSSFRVCLSSRHYPNITTRKGIQLNLDGHRGHNQDIDTYLAATLNIGHSLSAQSVRTEIQSRASGVFLWVVLVVSILNKDYDHGRTHRIRQRLEKIPIGLHDLFQNILTREDQEEDRKETILCIQWILFSISPLNPRQLRHAILFGIEPGDPSTWDSSTVTEESARQYIISCSKGLADVTVPRDYDTDRKGTVQFIHESVRDYLLEGDHFVSLCLGSRHNFEGRSHDQLKDLCLGYITVIYDRIPLATRHPFLAYAIANVLRHADAAARYNIDQAKFLQHFPFEPWRFYHRMIFQNQIPENIDVLYIIARDSLPNLIRHHPDRLRYLQGRNPSGPFPLYAALKSGHSSAVEAFVTAHAHALPSGDNLCAQCNDYSLSAELQDAFLSGEEQHASTPLACLIELGDTLLFALALRAIATGLLNASIHTRSGASIETLLIMAARYNRTGIAQMLINRGASIRACDYEGRTAYMWALKHNNVVLCQAMNEAARTNLNDRENICLQDGQKEEPKRNVVLRRNSLPRYTTAKAWEIDVRDVARMDGRQTLDPGGSEGEGVQMRGLMEGNTLRWVLSMDDSDGTGSPL